MIIKQNFTEINGRTAFEADELERQGYNPETHPMLLETVQAEENAKAEKLAAISSERQKAGYDTKYGNTELGDQPLTDEQVMDAVRLAAARVDNKTRVVLTPQEVAEHQSTDV